MEGIIGRIRELVALYGLNVVAALAIFVLGRIAASLVRNVVRKIMRKRKVDETLVGFVTNLLYAGILAFVVIAALAKLGIQTASFVAILGAAGLAIGLALQGSLSNFASGVLMIIFKPFSKGDYVDAGGASGSVDEIGIFTTIIKTLDNKVIIVPNSKITSDNITNYTLMDIRRVDLTVSAGYSADVDEVKATLMEILKSDQRILEDPPPFVGLAEMADSSVNFVVRAWVRTGDYWDVFFDTNEKIKKTFDAKGISIPFPQLDVHLLKEK